MDAKQVLQQFRDSFTASTVFGDPIDREGVTFIPVARIFGGGGGGQGQAHHTRGQTEGDNLPTHGEGWGGGYGAMAHAAGAYVIRDGNVRWQPVVDVNRVILGAQIATAALGAEVAVIVAALVFRGLFRSVFRG